MKTLEQVRDVRGFPICPGDLLRTPHFRGARRKQYYLYHVAVMKDGHLYAVPTQNLEPTMSNSGGTCLVKDLPPVTILSGFGPAPAIHFEDRQREPLTATKGAENE